MEREVTVENQKYKIRIGFGAYNRIESLSVFVRATNPANMAEVPAVPDAPMTQQERDVSTKANVQTATNVLVSEDIMTPEEAKTVNDMTFGQMKLIDLLEIERTLGEKVTEAKIAILKLAVRDANGRPITEDFLETGLSPNAGEKLFALVMETFDLLKKQIEDAENLKNS